MSEQREFTRIQRSIEVDLVTDRGSTPAVTRDISLNGLFAEAPVLPDDLVPGAVVDVHVHVDGRGGGATARGRGAVVRRCAHGLAIGFHQLLGAESYDMLRNLIRYNAVDPGRADREFATHLGLRRIGH